MQRRQLCYRLDRLYDSAVNANGFLEARTAMDDAMSYSCYAADKTGFIEQICGEIEGLGVVGRLMVLHQIVATNREGRSAVAAHSIDDATRPAWSSEVCARFDVEDIEL